MTDQFKNAQTFGAFTRKADARRVAKRMRDHGVITGLRGTRGYNEVFGYVPEKFTLADMERLATRMFQEGH